MRLKVKKVLAREFLILTSVFAIGLISFILTYPYNIYQRNKEEKIDVNIASKVNLLDSVKTSDLGINLKINISESNFRTLKEFDSTDGRHLSYNELKELIETSKGRKSYFDEFNRKMGFNDFGEFEHLIQTPESEIEFISSRKKIESIRTIKLAALQQDLDRLYNTKNSINGNILTLQEQYQLAIWVMKISFVILILLRFVYYGVFWSISTLRRKGGDTA